MYHRRCQDLTPGLLNSAKWWALKACCVCSRISSNCCEKSEHTPGTPVVPNFSQTVLDYEAMCVYIYIYIFACFELFGWYLPYRHERSCGGHRDFILEKQPLTLREHLNSNTLLGVMRHHENMPQNLCFQKCYLDARSNTAFLRINRVARCFSKIIGRREFF